MTTATSDARTAYNCPDWCIRGDHDADVVGDNNPPIHYGPDFGHVSVQLVDGRFEAVVYLNGEAAYVPSMDELRQASAEMVRAAEWVEAHR